MKGRISDQDELAIFHIIACDNGAANVIVAILTDAFDGAYLDIKGNVVYDNKEPVTLQQVLLKYLS